MWPEVRQAQEEKRYELVLTGVEVNQRIEDEGILDPTIYELEQLNFLRVSGTPLTTLRQVEGDGGGGGGDNISNGGIARLTNLTSLILQGNRLESLPESIGNLNKLKHLDVSRNLLESLPCRITNLSSLTSFNASGNRLSSLPRLEGCINLTVLDAKDNKLDEFPDICHEALVHLSDVLLGSNHLCGVPAGLSVLPSLKLLHLPDNKIKTVPGELAECPKLKELDLKGNPLTDRRLKKLVESERCIPRQVLNYIKQHCPLMGGEEGKAGGGKGKKAKGGRGKNKEKDEVDELCHEIQVLNQREASLRVLVDAEVKKVRPFIVCCILRSLNLDGDNLKKFIDLQTKLHDGVCEKRQAATIATHDLKKVQSPIKYQALPPEHIYIHPLVRGKVVTAQELYQGLRQDAENQRKQQKRNAPTGIHKYLHIVEKWESWPCLVDATGTVISLPPLTNSENTKILSDTTDILVEVTSGTSLPKAKEVMNELVLLTHKSKLGFNNTTSLEEPEEGRQEKVVLKVEQVRVEEEETGQLRVMYPSRVDLTNHADNIRVIMPEKR